MGKKYYARRGFFEMNDSVARFFFIELLRN